MIVKDIIMEDFANYKLPSMFVICPYCDFKCDKENGQPICQNSQVAKLPNINLSDDYIVDAYKNNNISQAIVFGGLEPFNSDDLQQLIKKIRFVTADPIIIYTGFTETEVKHYFSWIYNINNVIIKFGRFVPEQPSHFDEILGVRLASLNQYALHVN